MKIKIYNSILKVDKSQIIYKEIYNIKEYKHIFIKFN